MFLRTSWFLAAGFALGIQGCYSSGSAGLRFTLYPPKPHPYYQMQSQRVSLFEPRLESPASPHLIVDPSWAKLTLEAHGWTYYYELVHSELKKP